MLLKNIKEEFIILFQLIIYNKLKNYHITGYPI